MATPDELEQLISRTAEAAGSAVVGLGRGWGSGTGVVIADGRVLTCAHAVSDDTTVVRRADGTTADAAVLASDALADLAVLETDTAGVAPLAWADEAPRVGQLVLALGNPAGRGLRVTSGRVSAFGHRVGGRRRGRGPAAVEHTAPLPRGSSGGPLLDRDGRLLAINALRTDGGLILAIHADAVVRELVDALARGEVPRRPMLGVAIAPPRAARELRGAVGLPERDGLLVRAVEEGSPAAAAGVRRGDLIVRFAGAPTERIDALHAALESAGGGPVELGLVRGTEEISVPVALEVAP